MARVQAKQISGLSPLVWAPGVPRSPPVYPDWNEVESQIDEVEGAARLIVDTTGLGGGFAHMPSTANLDGRGRLEIVGGGPNGEAEIVIDDGGQIKNVREYRTIVFRAEPTLRPPIAYDLGGLIIECFDATFLFDFGGGGTQPIIAFAPNTYFGFYLVASSELRNSHNPGHAVVALGANTQLFLAINVLDFASSFDQTIAGPVTSSIDLQIDASVPPVISLPAFLGMLVTTQIDKAEGVEYLPNAPDWKPPPPSNVQQAITRMASLLRTLNGGVPIP